MNIAQLRRAAGAALIAVLALSACSPSESEPSTPEEGGPALGKIGAELAVAGGFGEKPEFTWPDSEDPTALDVEVLHEGDGPEVVPSGFVLADYEGYVWQRAESFDSTFVKGAPVQFPLDYVVSGWSETIPGHKVGSRLLITIPPEDGYGPDGNPGAGIGGSDTIVFVVDILDTFTIDSMGDPNATPVELPADSPILVDGGLGETFTLSVKEDADEPTEPANYALSEGAGELVEAGDSIIVSYALTTWDNEINEASWMDGLGPDGGPQTIRVGAGSGMDLLEGHRVGSRVAMIHIANGDLPALVIVADILAII